MREIGVERHIVIKVRRFIGSKVRASGERVLRELRGLKWLRFLECASCGKSS